MMIFNFYVYNVFGFQLGGIVKPNDGDCHLSPAGQYTEAENQVGYTTLIIYNDRDWILRYKLTCIEPHDFIKLWL